MRIDVDMSYEQYFEANRLFCLKTTRKRRWNFLAMWYLYPLLAALFGLLAVKDWFVEHRMSGTVWFNLALSVVFLWCRFNFPIRVRKLYEKMATNFRGEMTLSPAGMHFERKNGTAKVDYTWDAFESWMERPDMILVIPGPQSFIRIPKEKLTDAEQYEVRGWLSAASKRLD